MTKHLLIIFTLVALAACQTNPKEEPTATATPKDSIKTETGYADINGMKMYYEVHGQGRPLVLLHGSFMTIPLNWSNILPLLAKDYKVIVPELQGHGRTRDIAREISYEGMADDVSALLTHLKIDSADLLGYSMGGGVAFQMALRHAPQVRRLVIMSSVYTHDGWWPDAEAGFATFTPHMFNGTSIRKQYDSLGNDTAHFPEFVKKVIGIDLKKYDWSKEVKNIQAPIFMVMGDVDGVRYEHALELFRAKGGGRMGDLHGYPKARLGILPGTTHVGMLQRAEWLVPMVREFLESDFKETPPTF